MQTPLYMPLKDACARYGRARSLMYRLIGDDLIKAKKYGDSLLIVVEVPTLISAHYLTPRSHLTGRAASCRSSLPTRERGDVRQRHSTLAYQRQRQGALSSTDAASSDAIQAWMDYCDWGADAFEDRPEGGASGGNAAAGRLALCARSPSRANVSGCGSTPASAMTNMMTTTGAILKSSWMISSRRAGLSPVTSNTPNGTVERIRTRRPQSLNR